MAKDKKGTPTSFLKVDPYIPKSRPSHELGGMAPLGLAHAILGGWATRRRRQQGMVEGGERGGGRRPPRCRQLRQTANTRQTLSKASGSCHGRR